MGAVRPAILLARELSHAGHETTLVTPRFNEQVQRSLYKDDIRLVAVGPRSSFIGSYPTLDAWARNLIHPRTRQLICDADIIINTSSCIIVQSDIYYAQGLMTRALDDMLSLSLSLLKYPYLPLNPLLRLLERKVVCELRSSSGLFIANSSFSASMYKDWGIPVETIINPPLDCSFFKPPTKNPTADYVLTHMGIYEKEGRISVIRAIADAGVNLKVFGDRSFMSGIPKNYRNISFLGRVSNEELVDLYSNALYTLFAFNHEPFGYIPIESMACGTPVITYNKQGPSETVVNLETGWLARSDQQLTILAIDCWRNGYDSVIRRNCRLQALRLDVKNILKEWLTILDSKLDDQHEL